MAHYLQGLILAAGLAAAAPFSHKLHLKLVPECGTCHTAARSSASPGDNLLPAQAVCRSCHQEPQAIKAPEKTIVSRFSHRQHVSFGNMAPVIAAAIDGKTYHTLPAGEIRRHLENARNECQGCHRGLEESDAVTRANLPQMADCLVCHPRIDAPFSCELCHAAGPHLKPVSHVAGFLESHSSPGAKLDKPSCVICHGRRFTCLGCH